MASDSKVVINALVKVLYLAITNILYRQKIYAVNECNFIISFLL